MHQLTIEPPAEADIIDAMQFYEAQHPRLGTRFLHQLNAQLQRIGENPHQYEHLRRGCHKARLDRFPFLVLYRFDAERVYVVGVMDGRQNPAVRGRRAGWKLQ